MQCKSDVPSDTVPLAAALAPRFVRKHCSVLLVNSLAPQFSRFYCGVLLWMNVHCAWLRARTQVMREHNALQTTVPRPELERPHYVTMSSAKLHKLEPEPEAMLVLGDRESWCVHSRIAQAARAGHPVALGFCLVTGSCVDQDMERGTQILQASAARGHPIGLFVLLG